MTTAAAPVISSERSLNATLTVAGRVARVASRLLLVALMLLPVFGLLRAGGPLAGPLSVVGMLVITIVRPEDGLLLCAAFLPIGGPPGFLFGSPVPLREPFLLAFLAGWVLRETIRPEAPADSATRAVLLPAWLFAAVVAASTLVQLAAYQPFEDFPWPYAGRVLKLLAGGYVSGATYPGLVAGAMVLEAIALFTAVVVLCRRRPAFTASVVRMAVAGAVAVAALNLQRFVEVCVRQGASWHGILGNLRSLRISVPFPDVNAAGSYLAMMVLVAAGLAARSRRVRGAWAAAAVLLLAALWMTGSRAALLSVPVAAFCVLAWRARAKRRLSLPAIATVAAVVLAAVVLAALFFPRDTTNRGMPVTLKWRAGQATAAIRAFADYPAFGVGVGRFLQVSGRYFDPQLRQVFPHENAHNNYLQILAELGLAGLVPFLWILAAIARRIPAKMRSGGEPMLAGASAGVLAFLLTCLAGHPLLVREVALAFWLMLGLTASLALARDQAEEPVPQDSSRASQTLAPDFSPAARWRRWLLVAAILALAVSVPIRVHQFLENETDLERAAIGFSDWHFDGAGIRYRTMTGRAEFYVPGAACDMKMGLQVEAGGRRATAEVEIRVDGHAGNRFEAVTGSWRDARLVFPDSSARRYRKIQLLAVPDAGIVLRTARPVLVDCHGNRL